MKLIALLSICFLIIKHKEFYKRACEIIIKGIESVMINENQPLMCKCNAAGHGFSTFSPCSTTANPSLTDDGAKKKFSDTSAWLSSDLKGNRFKIPHSTCINRCVAY